MKTNLRYREQLRAIGAFLLDELDSLLAALQGSWKVEHLDNDRHGHVHATTLQVGRVSYNNIFTADSFGTTPINNYTHTRLRDAGVLRVSTSLTEVAITGIQVPQDELGAVLDGRVLIVENTSSTAIVALEHEHASSVAANRILVPQTPTGIANRYFCVPRSLTVLIYNQVASRWIIQGLANSWADVAYSAGNFTANGGGSWGVASGDVTTYMYKIDGNMMTVAFEIYTTDVTSGPSTQLLLAVPSGRTIARTMRNPILVLDAGGTGAFGQVVAEAGQTVLAIYRDPTGVANWTTTAADNTWVLGQITFMV